MKREKLILVGLLILAFVAFFVTRPVRERACPLTALSPAELADLTRRCTELGGVVVDGKCSCDLS